MMGAPAHAHIQKQTHTLSTVVPSDPPGATSPLWRPTLFTGADVQHAGAQAVPCRHTEAGVGRIDGGVGKDLAGGAEAEPRDALHTHVLLVLSIQRPTEIEASL